MKKKPPLFKTIYQLFSAAVRDFVAGDFVSQGAALSYYTFFAIAPLFIIVLAIAGFWFGEEAARKELFGQVGQLVGRDGGEAIQALVAAANKPHTGTWATGIAIVTLLIAST